MERTEAVELLERRRNAWLREDVDAYLSTFAEDFVFQADGVEESRGKASLEAIIRRSYEQFRPVNWEFHDIAVHGSNVLAEWTVTVEDRYTRATSTMNAMYISEVRNGVSTWIREYRAQRRK